MLEHRQVYSFRFYSRSSIVNVWLLEVLLCQFEHVAHHLDFAVNHSEVEIRNVITGCVVLD